ncbi:MAG TPA: cadherin-like domain-containing protein, partial [Prochlorococcaceae cyanobacterium Fu_MAG_50]|nr:cadherin-like domain-containing protein [Prochlorococcaceae cyanobacterium Fu_MAG_50]
LQGYSDVDGDALSITNLSATNGSISDNGNGTYSFSPDTNFNGTVSLTYNVIDGNGGSIEAQNSFSLTAVNDGPTLTGTPATLEAGSEDTTYTLTTDQLLQGYSDVDGDALSITTLSATSGSISDNGNGTYSFSPDTNFNGTVSLTYNVIDGNGGSIEAQNSFSLTSVNDGPTLTGTPATLAAGSEDTIYTLTTDQLLQGYSDVDGDALSITNLSATNGSISDNGNGTYSFFNGTVSLTYNVIDGNGGSIEAQNNFFLTAVNDDATQSNTLANPNDGTEDTIPLILDHAEMQEIDQILLSFNKALNDTQPAASRFKALVNNKKNKITSVNTRPEEGQVILNLKKAITNGDTITLSYKDLAGDQDHKFIEDTSGNDLETLSEFAVENALEIDSEAPIIEDAVFSKRRATLIFDEVLSVSNIKKSRFKVTVDGKRTKVSRIDIPEEDTIVKLTLRKKPNIESDVLISYKDPKRNQKNGVIEDLTGNDLESFRDFHAEHVSTGNGQSQSSSGSTEVLSTLTNLETSEAAENMFLV